MKTPSPPLFCTSSHISSNLETLWVILGHGGGEGCHHPTPERHACWCRASCKPSNPLDYELWITEHFCPVRWPCGFLTSDAEHTERAAGARRALQRGTPLFYSEINPNRFAAGHLQRLSAPLVKHTTPPSAQERRRKLETGREFLATTWTQWNYKEPFKKPWMCDKKIKEHNMIPPPPLPSMLEGSYSGFVSTFFSLNIVVFDMCLNCHSWSLAFNYWRWSVKNTPLIILRRRRESHDSGQREITWFTSINPIWCKIIGW